jgi:hypothetical protein
MVELSTLVSAGRTLDAAGIVWWVIDGTCLSLVRSGGMEEWQMDVDVGVWDVAGATAALKRDGWPDKGTWPNQFKSKGKLDVLGHRREGDQVLVHYVEDVMYGFSAHLFDNFGTVVAGDYEFRTPAPVEEYLSEHYGDWRTPVKEWVWQAAPCVVDGKGRR